LRERAIEKTYGDRVNPLSLIGFLAFFIVALVVGIRLLLLWRRTRQLPELLMGIGVLGIGPIGFGAMTIGAVSMSNPPVENAGYAIGTVAVGGGVLAKCAFNWIVYRRNSILAMAVTCGIGMLILVVIGSHVLDGQWAPRTAMAWDTLSRSLTQVGCLFWGSGESLYYWSRMRKRLKLGLADSVIVNRFLMWGLGAGFAGVGTGIGVTAEIATGIPTLQIPWVVSTSSVFGFAAAVSIYLAFVPPERYLRFVRGNA
jgi:hypothetical protein